MIPQLHHTARNRHSRFLVCAACGLSVLLAACGLTRPRDVRLYLEEPYPPKLSDWRLFTQSRGALQPNARVIPYDLNSPLFSDYASKYRFIWMPQGVSAQYRDDGPFEFPVGTIFVKSFAFPVDGRPGEGRPAEGRAGEEHLIETRLLVHAKSGWVGLPYIWNSAQTEATLQLVPDPVAVRWTDAAGRKHDFTYQIPNANECRQCHDNEKIMLPIGPKARNLNKDYAYADGPSNQLVRWTQAGYLRGSPPLESVPRAAKWDDPSTGSLDDRARAYLDNNCAHCHQPGGTAGYTGVDFRLGHFNSAQFGFCKRPNSAGFMGNLSYDLVAGHPEQSILIYRLESVAPKVMMPQIGRAVVHEEGLALVRAWVASLSPESCRPLGD